MNNCRFSRRLILLSGLCIIAVILIYFFPLQRFLAQHKLDEYMVAQGVDTQDIESVKFFKDYVQDGYYVSVKFLDDQHTYLYHYRLLALRKKTGDKFDFMTCDVYDSMNRCLDSYEEGVKYKSLEWG